MEEKKNLYYRSVICRGRDPLQPPGRLFAFISARARLLLEVFIRKDFGERYFGLIPAIFLTLFLAVWPIIWAGLPSLSSASSQLMSNLLGSRADRADASSPWVPYITWYIFLVTFLGFCIWHEMQIKRSYNSFDFTKYSLNDGVSTPFFSKYLDRVNAFSPRAIACLWEPLPFFVAGLLLALIGQSLGYLLILSSIFYSLGYRAEYNLGTHFVLDKIDERICAEELAESFSKPNPKKRNPIVKFAPPSSAEESQKMRPLFLGDDEVAFAK